MLSIAIRPSTQTRVSRQGAQGGRQGHDKDKGDEVTGQATSALTRADFLNELEAVPTVGPDSGAPVVEGLPLGSALLVVKRGPNAGSRFLLDRPVTSAGRHPGRWSRLCLLVATRFRSVSFALFS